MRILWLPLTERGEVVEFYKNRSGCYDGVSFGNFFFFFLVLFRFFLKVSNETDTTQTERQRDTDDLNTLRFICVSANNMAATANIVYASVCDKSEEWIENQLEHTTDKLGLVLCVNHRAMVLPMFTVEQIFDKRGYGKDKVNKWLARWKYLEKIDWAEISRLQRYVIFKEKPLDDAYLTKIDHAIERAKAEEKRINEEKQRKLEAIKAEGERKEAAANGAVA